MILKKTPRFLGHWYCKAICFAHRHCCGDRNAFQHAIILSAIYRILCTHSSWCILSITCGMYAVCTLPTCAHSLRLLSPCRASQPLGVLHEWHRHSPNRRDVCHANPHDDVEQATAHTSCPPLESARLAHSLRMAPMPIHTPALFRTTADAAWGGFCRREGPSAIIKARSQCSGTWPPAPPAHHPRCLHTWCRMTPFVEGATAGSSQLDARSWMLTAGRWLPAVRPAVRPSPASLRGETSSKPRPPVSSHRSRAAPALATW